MIGKILYGLLFCVFLPLGLGVWAWLLDVGVGAQLPSVGHGAVVVVAGGVAVVVGAGLMVCGMWGLWRRGGGLPMNAFPPPRFVASGAYRWVGHPIYTGFGLAVPGAAALVGSAAGLWIVTPVVWLGMVALVLGYERIDLERRFGAERAVMRPWLWLAADDDVAAGAGEKLAAALVSFSPWLVVYSAARELGVGSWVVDTRLGFERGWPVWEWAGVLYLGAYAWVAAAPWVARTRRELRVWTRDAWWGTAFIGWCFLVFPFVAPAREFVPESWLGEWVLADRAMDTIACAWPSFHVFWAFFAARLWRNVMGAAGAYGLAGGVAVSCVLVGNHSLADVVAGWVVFWGASRCECVWAWLLRWSEWVANSWRDWRVGAGGRVRIINHGGYVALAMVAGLMVAGWLLGPERWGAVVVVAVCGLAGAGLWGQWLEASSQLARPFGYFGGLFGGFAGVLVVQWIWGGGWLVAGAFAVVAPLIQGVGRLRCLVQGCCHGRPVAARVNNAKDGTGICYQQPLSRVVRIAGLGGVAVYPTQVFSMVSNVVVFGLLVRLWLGGAGCAFVAGVYLLLSTCARFVEEGYRGEPQTARWGGLAIYQWLAIGCLLAGMVFTVCVSPSAPGFLWSSVGLWPLWFGVPLGVVTWFFMGVDFPESSRRMSRLA